MTTKHKRWKVWRDTTMEAHCDDPWIGAPERHWVYRYAGHAFPTHAEALAHADRMARTVKFALPRAVGDGRRVPGAQNLRVGVAYVRGEKTVWMEDQSLSSIDLQPHELKPLALTLLALHYRNETP